MARTLRAMQEVRAANIRQLLLTQVTPGPMPPMQRRAEEN